MNAFTYHIFMIIIDPPLQKKCKILLLVLFVVSVENNNLFPQFSFKVYGFKGKWENINNYSPGACLSCL